MNVHMDFLTDEKISRFICVSVFLVSFFSATNQSHAAIGFEDVSATAGFTYEGRSWGAAWSDYNGDGLPDLWVTNHVSPPNLYLNEGNGQFQDVTLLKVPAHILALEEYDAHGAAWADYDNDGDQDLLQLVGSDLVSLGGSNPNLFLENVNGVFLEKAESLGLNFTGGRGRMPLWFDANNDGRLDIYNPTDHPELGASASALFQYVPELQGYLDIASDMGIAHTSNRGRNYAILGDVTGDWKPDLLLEENMRFPYGVFDLVSYPFNSLTLLGDFSRYANEIISDVVIADFDGDLDNDLLMVKGERREDVVLAAPNILEGHFGGKAQSERGIRFKASGDVVFDLTFLEREWPFTIVNIGANRLHPDRPIITLSSTDTRNHGIASHMAGIEKGIFIGYEPATGEWVFLVSSYSMAKAEAFIMHTDISFSQVEAIGWDPLASPPADRYFVRNGAMYDEMARVQGLEPTAGRSVVAGDFDNDMDLDLYMVSTSPVANIPNVVYENLGSGYFVRVPDGGGAAGTLKGRGDAVAMADFDVDGYLDLLVTNGKSRRPFEEDGPVQLFRNTGSGNHWLQLDLEGVRSNRDAVGAAVLLKAGGVLQRREQNGGIHSRAQNQQRVHFGLGPNGQVQDLLISWPSGVVQQISGVPSDQVLHVIEPLQPPIIGKPDYQAGVDTGVYIWKENASGDYTLRVSAGTQRTEFTIKLISDQPLVNAQAVLVENQDQWQRDSHGFIFNSVVARGQDGVEFSLAPGAKAMISVEKDGVANPRQIHVGAQGSPLTPAGWIVDLDEFPVRPDFTNGAELGLFFGKNTSGALEVRLNGDGPWRTLIFDVMGATPLSSFSPVLLEAKDEVVQTTNAVSLVASMGAHMDGMNVSYTPDVTGSATNIGFAYRQDSIVNVRNVNRNDGSFGKPNAYWLP